MTFKHGCVKGIERVGYTGGRDYNDPVEERITGTNRIRLGYEGVDGVAIAAQAIPCRSETLVAAQEPV